jgi:hypothetical protein
MAEIREEERWQPLRRSYTPFSSLSGKPRGMRNKSLSSQHVHGLARLLLIPPVLLRCGKDFEGDVCPATAGSHAKRLEGLWTSTYILLRLMFLNAQQRAVEKTTGPRIQLSAGS